MPADKKSLLEKASEVLEWPELVARLTERARSGMGAAACKAIPLAFTVEAAKRSLAETSEMAGLLSDEGSVPLGAFEDLRPILERAQKGAIPEPSELAGVSSVLELSRLTRGFFKNQHEQCPLLWERAQALEELHDLKKEIDRAIDSSGKLKENASPELKRLTQSIRDRRGAIVGRIEEFMRSDEVSPILMDEFYTQRGSRYVLPIKSEFRAKIEGIVHDSSNSGQTLFIEPRIFINANNELKIAEMEIEQEARRILKELGVQVGSVADALRANLEILSELDVIYAKARLSLDLKATEPEVNSLGRITLIAARHPLLVLSRRGVASGAPTEDEADVVPNDIRLSEDLSALVISGPNTGGKTVTMKTLGLFALMVRAGIHISAGDGSEMPVFPEIYADIGDEQDIGRHLSTFSGHILNIIGILDAATRGSLVLLDELVTSTDPAEGSALAEAVLNRLASLGAKTVATTHYAQLKAYAQAHPKFANASVEFNNETLAPTYRLIMGVPGRSSALEIAQRLGMAQPVIARAKELLGSADRRIEDMLVSLERQKQNLIEETKEAEQQRGVARALAEEHERIRAELRVKEREFKSSLRSRLNSETDTARRKIQEIMQSLTKERTRKQAIYARKKLKEIEARYREGILVEGEKVDPASLKEGANVVIAHLGAVGVLMEDVMALDNVVGAQRAVPVQKSKVRVRIGRVPMVVPTDSLRIDPGASYGVEGSVPQERNASTRAAQYTDIAFPGTRLDLRGQRAEDSLDELQKFLDRAALAQIPEVEIIHGHGTGALKKVIRAFLDKSPYVQQWKPADLKQGGDGVTIAQMRL